MASRYESWFPHDANASSDPKLQAVISEFGWEGIGWYWDILARLRIAPGHCIEWNRPYIQASLARFYDTDIKHLQTFIDHCSNGFDLLILEDGLLRSHGMDKNMEELDIKREKNAEAGRASGEARRQKALLANERSTDDEQTFNGRSTDVEQIR
jgi:hypothetical protein